MSNKKWEIEDLKKFTSELQNLIDDHHHTIYLIDDVFKGYDMMLQAVFTEIKKLENQD